MRVVVAQKGAREHYLAARALARKGQLAALVTDWYAPRNRLCHWILGHCGSAGRRMLSARTDELNQERIITHRWSTLVERLTEVHATARKNKYDYYEKTDSAFSRWVVGLKLPPHDVLFMYSYAALETLEAARGRGVFTILDQIDPGPAEFRLVAEESRAWPLYAKEARIEFPSGYYARLEGEWDLADLIVVNSEWSRHALIGEGVPAGKIEVLPLAYEGPRLEARPMGRRGPLRVLWFGQVNIRKGIQYLVEAAKSLVREPVEIMVAGPILIGSKAVTAAPRNLQWLGSVPRSEASRYYAMADIFVLPTLSDGFAITQLEAMAHGLPVIVTPNCGCVVEDAETGFVIPPYSSEALAEAILRFAEDPSLVDGMSPRCVQSARTYSIDAYASRLAGIIDSRLETAI